MKKILLIALISFASGQDITFKVKDVTTEVTAEGDKYKVKYTYTTELGELVQTMVLTNQEKNQLKRATIKTITAKIDDINQLIDFYEGQILKLKQEKQYKAKKRAEVREWGDD